MLTAHASTAVTRGPTLDPLVVGSPAARILNDVWTGVHSVAWGIEDHRERLQTASTVAAHLAARARYVVAVHVMSTSDRKAVVRLLEDQLGDGMVVSLNDWRDARPPNGLAQRLNGGPGVAVSSFSGDAVGASTRINLVVAGHLWPPHQVATRSFTDRVVYLESGPTDPVHPHAVVAFELGPIPLDIVLAGAPEP